MSFSNDNFSVEQVLVNSGIYQNFSELVQNLSKKNKKKLRNYLRSLESYIEKMQGYKEYETVVANINQQREKKTKQLKSSKGNTTTTSSVGLTGLKQRHSASLSSYNRQRIKTDFIKLMKLEMNIINTLRKMGFIEKGSAVTTYVIYFYGEKNSEGGLEIIRGEIPINSEIIKDSLFVDSQGNINLGASITKAIMETQKYSKIVINNDTTYQEDMDGLIEEAGSFYNDIVKKVSSRLKESKSNHLGNDKDSELDAANSALSQQVNVEAIIEEHQKELRQQLYANERYEDQKRNYINRGFLSEAFERLYQAHKKANPNEPTIDYATALKESLGNDPWYITGDVGPTQVKAFFDNAPRQVASFNSLVQLLENLKEILKNIIEGEKESTDLGAIQDATEKDLKKNNQSQKAKKVFEDKITQKAKELVDQVLPKKS